MAVGDSNNMLSRLNSLVPGGWFSDVAPVRDIVLGGLSDSLAWAYSILQVAKAGTRRQTTTGWLLDLDAYGFFGSAYLRRPNETDASWEKRYIDEIFRPKVTRAAIDQALFDLTGRHPIINELWNTADVGAYDTPRLAYGGGNATSPRVCGYGNSQGGYGSGQLGYGVRSRRVGTSTGRGAWGSLNYPYQIFITAFRPLPPNIPFVAGYGTSAGGYGVGRIMYADVQDAQNAVSDADIYARVATIVAGGVTAWVAIS